LVDTKASTNSSLTLLHFLANTIESKLPHINEFIEELKDSGLACRVSQQEMTGEYRLIGTKLNDLEVELDKNFTDVELEENDRFPEIMRDFVKRTKSQFEELQLKYTSMEVAYKDVVSYFGEDPKSTKPDEFFGIFKTFISSYERARHDNKVQKERELVLQKRIEEIESRKKKQKDKTSISVKEGIAQDSSEEKYLMDNLLETLRDGRDLDTRTRRKRGAGKEKRIERSMSIAVKAESILNRLKEDTPPVPDLPIKEILAE
ncbi:4272_t:CDS:2, partial [Entrophospora sp. SA101]